MEREKWERREGGGGGWRAKPYPDADPQQINKYACGCRYPVQPDRDMTFSVVDPGRKLSAFDVDRLDHGRRKERTGRVQSSSRDQQGQVQVQGVQRRRNRNGYRHRHGQRSVLPLAQR